MTLPPTDPEQPFDDSGPEQARVRSLLSGLPDPGPMPDDLVLRIQARLADEALTAGSATHHGSTGVVDLTARRRMRLMTGVAALGGVAAAAAVVGVVLTGGLHPRTDDGAAALTAKSSAGTATSAPQVTVRLQKDDVTASTLDSHASALLQADPDTVAPGAAEAPSLGPIATPTGITDCLVTLGVPSYAKASAGLVTFEKKPAVVIGLRTTGGELQAWVVDRTCHELAPHHIIS